MYTVRICYTEGTNCLGLSEGLCDVVECNAGHLPSTFYGAGSEAGDDATLNKMEKHNCRKAIDERKKA